MPNLQNCSIKFHTNNKDKHSDTHVTATVRDADQVIAARIDSDFGHFYEDSNNGPFGLTVRNPSSRGSLEGGSVSIRIDPNGPGTWRFNFFLDLAFDDGSHLSGTAEDLELSQERQEVTLGLEGIGRTAKAAS